MQVTLILVTDIMLDSVRISKPLFLDYFVRTLNLNHGRVTKLIHIGRRFELIVNSFNTMYRLNYCFAT